MIILKSKKENFRMPKKEEETHTVSLSRVPPPGMWGRGAPGRTPCMGSARGTGLARGPLPDREDSSPGLPTRA